ncbi:hypothetical protein ABZ848_40510 [Streptomyces sp. NPDC047081]|uniref:hypothetical protein n=1 Tax=Streptomyces sp. NPDC047081 TaxID=3154706 RepID=UPI0033F617C7
MTSDMVRPRWRSTLPTVLGFVAGGGLGLIGYAVVMDRPVAAMSWGGLLFGAVVCVTLSALLARRRNP